MLSHWKDLFDKNLKQRLKELDNCIQNQHKFNQLIVELIENLDFEDANSKEKEEKKDSTKEDSSKSEAKNDEKDLSQKEEKESSDSDLNVVENSLEASSEDKEF